MPKAFIISRRIKNNQRENQDGFCTADVIENSRISIQETEQKPDQQKDDLKGNCSLSKCDKEKVEVHQSLDSEGLVRESEEPASSERDHKALCAGEQESQRRAGFTVEDKLLWYCASSVSEHSQHEGKSSKISMIRDIPDKWSGSYRGQSDVSDLSAENFVSTGKTKDPRRAILFLDSKEEKCEFTDFNNNIKGRNNNNHDYSGDHKANGDECVRRLGYDKAKMPSFVNRNGSLGTNFDQVLSTQSECPSRRGPEVRRKCASYSHAPDNHSTLKYPFTQAPLDEEYSTHAEAFYSKPFLSEFDSGVPWHQSFRFEDHRGLINRSPSVMSAFRPPVKPVQTDPSLPSLPSSSLFSPTTTATPLRKLSPSLQSGIDNRNTSWYHSGLSGLTTATVPGSSSMVMVGEEDEQFSSKHKDGISKARDNVPTDKIHFGKASGNIGTIGNHTQEVTVFSTGQAIRGNRQLIKDSACRADQRGAERARSGTPENGGTTGPRTADRDRPKLWTGGHQRSRATEDCHLVTGKR